MASDNEIILDALAQSTKDLTQEELLSLLIGACAASKHDNTLRIPGEAIRRFIDLGADGMDIAVAGNGDFIVKLTNAPVEG